MATKIFPIDICFDRYIISTRVYACTRYNEAGADDEKRA